MCNHAVRRLIGLTTTVALLLTLAPALSSIARQLPATTPSISATLGWDGSYRPSEWAPVETVIKDVPLGDYLVELSEPNRGGGMDRLTSRVTADGSVARFQLFVALGNDAAGRRIDLYDASRTRLIATQSLAGERTFPVGPDEAFVIAAVPPGRSLPSFTGVGEVARVAANRLPLRAELYEPIDLLLLDGDVGLDTAVADAVVGWVRGGGTLMVYPGLEGNLASLEALLPAKATGWDAGRWTLVPREGATAINAEGVTGFTRHEGIGSIALWAAKPSALAMPTRYRVRSPQVPQLGWSTAPEAAGPLWQSREATLLASALLLASLGDLLLSRRLRQPMGMGAIKSFPALAAVGFLVAQFAVETPAGRGPRGVTVVDFVNNAVVARVSITQGGEAEWLTTSVAKTAPFVRRYDQLPSQGGREARVMQSIAGAAIMGKTSEPIEIHNGPGGNGTLIVALHRDANRVRGSIDNNGAVEARCVVYSGGGYALIGRVAPRSTLMVDAQLKPTTDQPVQAQEIYSRAAILRGRTLTRMLERTADSSDVLLVGRFNTLAPRYERHLSTLAQMDTPDGATRPAATSDQPTPP